MATLPLSDPTTIETAEKAAREFVSVRHWGRSSFISLPLYGPDGSPITVRVTADMGGFRVDDAGFTYRDLKRLGIERSFSKTAAKIADRDDLSIEGQAIFALAGADDLARAVSDVGLAAWLVLDKIHGRLDGASEEEIEEGLRERLAAIFPNGLDQRQTITGMSTTLWSVSAILHVNDKLAVFQAVGDHANSIYRASAAFHDLASLPDAPTLVSVVRDKAALGAKLSLLAQAGRVIEEGQSDDVFRRAAA